jgi:hypothetical protein
LGKAGTQIGLDLGGFRIYLKGLDGCREQGDGIRTVRATIALLPPLAITARISSDVRTANAFQEDLETARPTAHGEKAPLAKGTRYNIAGMDELCHDGFESPGLLFIRSGARSRHIPLQELSRACCILL